MWTSLRSTPPDPGPFVIARTLASPAKRPSELPNEVASLQYPRRNRAENTRLFRDARADACASAGGPAPEVAFRRRERENDCLPMRLSIRPPADNERGPVHTESLLRLLHRADPSRRGIELQVLTNRGEVGLAVECPDESRALFREALLDAYPGSSIVPLDEITSRHSPHCRASELWWTPDVCTLRTSDHFHDSVAGRFVDPLGPIFSALRCGRSGRIECAIRLSLKPASHRTVRHAERIHRQAARRFFSHALRHRYLALATHPQRWRRILSRWLLRAISRSAHEPQPSDKLTQPLFECRLQIEVHAPVEAEEFARRKLREIAGAFGQFATTDAAFITVASRPQRRHRRGFLLAPAEVSSLWHPLAEAERAIARVESSNFREVEPPLRLPTTSPHRPVTLLGRVQFRQQRDQFGIHLDDLRRHLIVVGKTGSGKSNFLQNIVLQQIEQNRGVVLVDPHGQLVDDVLDFIPQRRTNDVILFDASDRLAPVGFNPLIGPPGSDPTLVADGVLTAFKNVFGFDEATAPRLLHIFRNSLLSLIGRRDASLITVQRLLTDANYRKSVVAAVMNPAVQSFWLTEFDRWQERDRTQYLASLQNKLGAFTTNERLQAILGATEKGIQLRPILDRSQILLCNLSKGTVGHDASTLLGSLLLSSLQVAAMSRANVPEDERPDAVVVIDEFHSYLSPGNTTMADALAESRKYRTSYVLSTQLLEQLDPATLAGVLGNCGSTLCMTVGPRDAAVLAELLGEGLTPEDLMRIPKYHGYLRLLVEGAPHTFSMTTLPPSRLNPKRANLIRQVSRQRHGLS